MKLETLTDEQRQVLKDIQQSVPKEWTDKVTKREDIAPATKEILERAIIDPEVNEQFKKEARLVLQTGILNQQIDVEQQDIAELIDSYVELEIIKAVMLKRLPPLKKKKNYEVALKRHNKLKQKYEKGSNN